MRGIRVFSESKFLLEGEREQLMVFVAEQKGNTLDAPNKLNHLIVVLRSNSFIVNCYCPLPPNGREVQEVSVR